MLIILSINYYRCILIFVIVVVYESLYSLTLGTGRFKEPINLMLQGQLLSFNLFGKHIYDVLDSAIRVKFAEFLFKLALLYQAIIK